MLPLDHHDALIQRLVRARQAAEGAHRTLGLAALLKIRLGDGSVEAGGPDGRGQHLLVVDDRLRELVLIPVQVR